MLKFKNPIDPKNLSISNKLKKLFKFEFYGDAKSSKLNPKFVSRLE